MNSCPFSKYRHIFGKVGKGVHKFTFLGTPIVDFILTIIIACITTYLTNIPLVLTIIEWLILAIILHILFGVETNVVKYLGFKC